MFGKLSCMIHRCMTALIIAATASSTAVIMLQARVQLICPSQGYYHTYSTCGDFPVADLNGDRIPDMYFIDYEKGEIIVFLSQVSDQEKVSR